MRLHSRMSASNSVSVTIYSNSAIFATMAVTFGVCAAED